MVHKKDQQSRLANVRPKVVGQLPEFLAERDELTYKKNVRRKKRPDVRAIRFLAAFRGTQKEKKDLALRATQFVAASEAQRSQ